MVTPPYRHIEPTNHGNVEVVRILDRTLTDEPPLDELREELQSVVANKPGTNLVIDLGGVDFLSSAMLDTLGQLHRKLALSGARIKLCRVHPAIAEVLRITHLDRLFTIHADADAARASFS